jgi:hypothetical protein
MPRLTDLIPVPEEINAGLTNVKNDFMLALMGNPRSTYSRQCEGPTNDDFLKRVVWGKNVGPFKVSGFDLAVSSLKEVCADIKKERAEVYHAMETVGMLCCRMVRGSRSIISNHSWGTAIDIKIGGVLDRRGNDKVQIGLSEIAVIFNRHGWYWGAGFTIEDGMHFEISKEKIIEWHEDGKLFSGRTIPSRSVLRLGSRGTDVAELQSRLNQLAEDLLVDGDFGIATQAAVIDFQSRNDLEPDGIVGKRTWRILISQTDQE